MNQSLREREALTKRHKSYMKVKFSLPRKLKKYFTSGECELLEKFGTWFDALTTYKISAYTKAQVDFINVMHHDRKPETEHEIVWKKYIGHKEQRSQIDSKSIGSDISEIDVIQILDAIYLNDDKDDDKLKEYLIHLNGVLSVFQNNSHDTYKTIESIDDVLLIAKRLIPKEKYLKDIHILEANKWKIKIKEDQIHLDSCSDLDIQRYIEAMNYYEECDYEVRYLGDFRENRNRSIIKESSNIDCECRGLNPYCVKCNDFTQLL